MSLTQVQTGMVADAAITTAKVQDAAVTTAKIQDAAVTQSKMGSNVAGNGPTFAYGPGGSNQNLSQAVWTKVTMFTSLGWDTTSGMYSSNRFTPTVAGYYFITAASVLSSANGQLCIYKNGSGTGTYVNAVSGGWMRTSGILYLNGTTDYIEIYAYAADASQYLISNGGLSTFQACLIRSA